jgi:hypothetical protein
MKSKGLRINWFGETGLNNPIEAIFPPLFNFEVIIQSVPASYPFHQPLNKHV